MSHTTKKYIFLTILSSILIGGTFITLHFVKSPHTLTSTLSDHGTVGTAVQENFALTPTVAFAQNDNGYEISDDLNTGIQITYANQTEEQKQAEEANKKQVQIQFPKDYAQPIEIRLDQERVITITDQNAQKYSSKILTEEIPLTEDQQTFFTKDTYEDKFLSYTNKRKSIYYAYQRDSALNDRKLKNWIIYDAQDKGNTEEKETYKIENAKIKKNGQGQVEIFYFGEKQIQNEQVKADVEPSLLERAQRTLEKEMGEDIMNNTNHTPDFIIPEPYYINKDGNKKILE